ncbi:DUF7544 domain-containing protein [Halomarina litorea]|uniref:DUF7544 domain-containing protein n=1 Tax=Halomarina litorea TaxID=2961595 RepID=UPI0020C451F4|nr:hypothetical protein [Halomarina sp. BCD28]
MVLHAISDLDEAFEATRDFLLPFDARTWLRLAVVVFFVGGASAQFSGTNFQFSGDDVPGEFGEFGEFPAALPVDLLTLAVALVALGVLLALGFLYLGSVMEFVLLDAVRRDSPEVALRRSVRRHARRGLRLFGFRVALGLAVLTTVALLVAPVVLTLAGGPTDPASVGIVVLVVPLVLLVAGLAAVVDGFTAAFVAPVMLLESRRVVAGWRRFWPTLRREWKQYLAYALVGVALNFVAGIGLAVVGTLVALTLLVPFGLVGGLVVLAALGTGGLSVLAGAALAGIGLLYVACLLVALAVALVPVRTYLRYYSLFVLGDTEAAFDLVPAARARTRPETARDESA